MPPRKYEQHRRAEMAAETRRRILDAVYDHLHTQPADPVSVDRIARDAQVSRSTVYLIFGSRGGLFDALAEDVLRRGGFERVMEAVANPDAREHLRGGIRGGAHTYAAHRDVLRVLFSMAQLDGDAVGGAVQRMEANRADGAAYLAQRLGAQGLLRAGVSVDEAADLLWVLISFDSFDLLYTGRKLTADEVADVLIETAERSLLR